MNETQIIRSVCAGNVDDYAQLVERYHVGLIIHCERIVHDRMAAEDIAQEAFIAAFSQLQNFESSKGRFSTWLYRIATHKAIDYLRAQKRVVPTEAIELLEATPAPDYADVETKREVTEAVQALQPPTHRQAIEAYYWQGKSYKQIAEEMKVPINTVRTWLRRAKADLRSELS